MDPVSALTRGAGIGSRLPFVARATRTLGRGLLVASTLVVAALLANEPALAESEDPGTPDDFQQPATGSETHPDPGSPAEPAHRSADAGAPRPGHESEPLQVASDPAAPCPRCDACCPRPSNWPDADLRESFLYPLGLPLAGWELNVLHLVPRDDLGGNGLAGGIRLPMIGPGYDFGVVGSFNAYLGGGTSDNGVGWLGAILLELGVGADLSRRLTLGLLGGAGVSGWQDQIPDGVEVASEVVLRWEVYRTYGPFIYLYGRPSWIPTSEERRRESRLSGIHELTAGLRIAAEKRFPLAAELSCTETMGTQLIVLSFGAALFDFAFR